MHLLIPGFYCEIVAIGWLPGGPHLLRMRDGIEIRIYRVTPGFYEAHIERGPELLSLLAGNTSEQAKQRALDAWRQGWD